MKNLFLGLLTTVLFSFNANANNLPIKNFNNNEITRLLYCKDFTVTVGSQLLGLSVETTVTMCVYLVKDKYPVVIWSRESAQNYGYIELDELIKSSNGKLNKDNIVKTSLSAEEIFEIEGNKYMISNENKKLETIEHNGKLYIQVPIDEIK